MHLILSRFSCLSTLTLLASGIATGFFIAMKKDIDWEICRGLETKVHVNLNNGLMSLTQKVGKSYLVVGHTDNLVLEYPRFYVSDAGRNRVIKEQSKNVHAWAIGRLLSPNLTNLPPLQEIFYCPYTQSHFTWKESREAIITADLFVVIDNQVLCSTSIQQPQLSLF